MNAASILTVPGLGGSGPDHWQTLWERERPDCQRVQQADWDNPDPEDWLLRIEAAAARLHGPAIIAAHSLGCLAVAGWAQRFLNRRRNGPLALLLVAPCDAEATRAPRAIKAFSRYQYGFLPHQSVVVASTNDPYATIERSFALAREWGSKLLDAGAHGHINAQSQLGSWDFGQGVVDALAKKLNHRIAA